MDKFSWFGLILGFAAVITAQVLEGAMLGSLLQSTAFLIVVGGTVGAVMLQTSWPVFKAGFQMVKWVFAGYNTDLQSDWLNIVRWSQFARRDGLLALEQFATRHKDPFVREGLQLLLDATDPEVMREILAIKIEQSELEMHRAARIWESAGSYSPTFGILGAVIGLIHVMENLTDPSKLGSGIAVAFVATVYGVGFANLLYLPIYGKLCFYIDRITARREMFVEAFVCIAQGHHPRLIESRLKGFMQNA